MSTWEIILDDENRAELLQLVREVPAGWRITFEEAPYTDPQRQKLNAMCGDIARQVTWNGERLKAEEWKHWLDAAWRQLRMVRGLEPGTIVFVGTGLGRGKGRKSKATTSDMIELAYWFGAQRGITWSEGAKHTPAGPAPAQLEEGNTDETN